MLGDFIRSGWGSFRAVVRCVLTAAFLYAC
nr:MAG TPA: hypothetical protein [Myoviridae sp. ctyhU11]